MAQVVVIVDLDENKISLKDVSSKWKRIQFGVMDLLKSEFGKSFTGIFLDTKYDAKSWDTSGIVVTLLMSKIDQDVKSYTSLNGKLSSIAVTYRNLDLNIDLKPSITTELMKRNILTYDFELTDEKIESITIRSK